MRRRGFLESMTAAGVGLTAGCLDADSIDEDLDVGFFFADGPTIAWEHAGSEDVVALETTPDRTVVATERQLLALSRADGDPAWGHDLRGISALVSDDSRWYVYGNGGVLAVDRSSGDELWRVGGSYQRLFRADSAVVCYRSNGRETIGFDPETGDKRWTWEGTMVHTYTPEFGLVPGDGYRGFDLNQGTVEWSYRDGDRHVPVDVTDGTVVLSVRPLGAASRSLVALDRETGTETWRFGDVDARSWAGGVIDGTLYAAAAPENGSKRLSAIDLESGRDRWTVTLDEAFDIGTTSPETVVGDTVIVSTPWGQGLPTTCAVDRSTGTLEWTREDHGLVSVSGDELVFTNDDGEFLGIRPDGSLAWEGNMRVVPRVSSPATGELVYTPPEIVTFEDAFAAAFVGTNGLELWGETRGRRRWRHQFEGTIDGLFAGGDDLYTLVDGTLVSIPVD
ncbi:PQQ-binding-like beta-propeller repeat protein [Natrarchaeobius sp. A-rgal3]|uniref:outer membrane protein assembly factor BamB family protein n=1 Tax=Natrarchaeobius versutus TaxID=1679078 RepID=UPI003510131D